ncbi:MAG: ATP-binding protein [Saprospiraceae bacterium]
MSQVFTSLNDRKIFFAKVGLYCLIALCFIFTISNSLYQRYEVGLYNFIFGVLFTIVLMVRKKSFDLTVILTGLICQALFFGHAYFVIPGKFMEDGLGVMMAILPIFSSGRRMWFFAVTNTILFHVAFFAAGYGDVFYFKYVFYVVLFIIIYTITKINENHEKELVVQRDKIKSDADRLKELDELKNRFFANVSHELRTPLTLVLSPLDSILKSGELSERNLSYLQLVQQNAQNLHKRINELLELSRLDANHLAVNPVPTDVFQLVSKILALHEGAADLKGIQLKSENAISGPAQLLLDAEKLEMILSNYLSNAIKFTPENGLISVTVQKENEELLISVKDNGIGIPEADIDKIFDRFYQVKNQEYTGGTGIGLSLCKELAEVLGGSVRVESEVGKGSVFYLKLPFVESGAEPEIQSGFEYSFPKTPNIKPEYQQILPTVLIVEDNYDLRQYMTLLLSEKYNVVTAENGKAALECLRKPAPLPSAIVSDIMMPEMDGMELLHILKNDDTYRQIPVIMLTAQIASGVKIDALRIGVDDYLTKPFNELELVTRVGNLISNYQNRTAPLAVEMGEIEENTPPAPGISQADLKWLEKVEQIVVENIANPNHTLNEVAPLVNLSYNGFQQKIKKITGLTPKQYQRSIKLNKARLLLKSGEVETVSEVLYQLGFDNHYYFSKIYQQEFGIMPTEELKKNAIYPLSSDV